MDAIKSDKMGNKLIMVAEVLVLISAIASALICFTANVRERLWVLPLIYAVCFYVVIWGKSYVVYNYFLLIIVGISYLRNVITPAFFYTLNVEPWQLGNNAEHYHVLYNVGETILILALEMIATFGIIKLFGEKLTVIRMSEKTYMKTNAIVCIVIVLGILLMLLEPYYLGLYDAIFQFYDYTPTSEKTILLEVSTVLMTMWLTIIIRRQEHVTDFVKVCLTGVIWMLFCLEASFGGNPEHVVGRWTFVINLLIGGILIMGLYPRYTKKLLCMLGGIGLLAIGVLSVLRGFNVTKFFSYVNFNDYFAGPTNISFVVDMCNSDEYNITFRTFLGDVFGNVPIINHLLVGKDNTIYYFCQTIFGLSAEEYERLRNYDKIMPFTGQMYTYFSYVGVLAGNAILTYLTLYSGYLVEKVKNFYLCYVFLFIALLLSLGTAFNINIICQYLSIYVMPVALVMCADWFVGYLTDKFQKVRKLS